MSPGLLYSLSMPTKLKVRKLQYIGFPTIFFHTKAIRCMQDTCNVFCRNLSYKKITRKAPTSKILVSLLQHSSWENVRLVVMRLVHSFP